MIENIVAMITNNKGKVVSVISVVNRMNPLISEITIWQRIIFY
jgi:hypothetical protein